jgi:parvulin-like peptidyl-prolyl isomerase
MVIIKSLIFLFAATCAHAQDEKPLAVVNGKAIPGSALVQAVQRAVDKGAIDTPELRSAVKSQLIARELFAQEARALGLDRDPAVNEAAEEARTNAMVALYLKGIQPKRVTESDVKAQYARIVASLGPEEYKLRIILVGELIRANEALAAAGLGEPFAAIAQRYSIAPSATRGGELDWVSFKSPPIEGRTNGLPLPVAQALEKLKPGDVSAPLAFKDQWLIVRLEEKRPTVVLSFDQARSALLNMLAARELDRATTELVNALVKGAKIVTE